MWTGLRSFEILENIGDSSCDILAKSVTAFCLCPKNLPETKLKSFGLMLLAEISEQQSIDCPVVISEHCYADL